MDKKTLDRTKKTKKRNESFFSTSSVPVLVVMLSVSVSNSTFVCGLLSRTGSKALVSESLSANKSLFFPIGIGGKECASLSV